MNNRIKSVIGTVIIICIVIVADKIIKSQNRVTDYNTPENNNNSNVLEITKKEFEDEVLNSDKKVFIDFYASWCGPCQYYSPIVEEVSTERDDYKFVKINVDKEEKIAADYSVYSYPTSIIIENGEEINRVLGAINKERLNAFLDEN